MEDLWKTCGPKNCPIHWDIHSVCPVFYFADQLLAILVQGAHKMMCQRTQFHWLKAHRQRIQLQIQVMKTWLLLRCNHSVCIWTHLINNCSLYFFPMLSLNLPWHCPIFFADKTQSADRKADADSDKADIKKPLKKHPLTGECNHVWLIKCRVNDACKFEQTDKWPINCQVIAGCDQKKKHAY